MTTANLNLDYKWGLPPLAKPTLEDFIELEEFDFFKENIAYSDIDGFPYFFNIVFLSVDNSFAKGEKISIYGEDGLYSVKSVIADENGETHIETKLDKTLLLTNRTVEKVKDYYLGWGMKKESEKIKCNYKLGDQEFNIEGKLSKNQTFQWQENFYKITDLKKNEDKTISILCNHIEVSTLTPLFPYKKNGEIIAWYEDKKDVWVRQAREYMENR